MRTAQQNLSLLFLMSFHCIHHSFSFVSRTSSVLPIQPSGTQCSTASSNLFKLAETTWHKQNISSHILFWFCAIPMSAIPHLKALCCDISSVIGNFGKYCTIVILPHCLTNLSPSVFNWLCLGLNCCGKVFRVWY